MSDVVEYKKCIIDLGQDAGIWHPDFKSVVTFPDGRVLEQSPFYRRDDALFFSMRAIDLDEKNHGA